MIIAAYGTLRKGYGNSRLVDKKTNYLGQGITKEKYCMTASGIPFVNENKQVSNIVVDLWDIDEDQLEDVDRLEGYNPSTKTGWYYRKPIEVIFNEDIVVAEIYFNNDIRGEVVSSGDYNDYMKKWKANGKY